MSEIIVLSDIHANAPALRAVIEKEGQNTDYAILGDILGLCAYPAATVSLVREVGTYVLAGNHDKAIVEYGEGHVVSDELSAFERDHTLQSLDSEACAYIHNLSHLDVIQRGGARMCLTHALPWPEMASGYERGNAGLRPKNILEVVSSVSDDYDWVLCGHSHEQFHVDCSKFDHDIQVVNPGSLGYDDTYTVIDPATDSVEHKSVSYDEVIPNHIRDVMPDNCPDPVQWFDP